MVWAVVISGALVAIIGLTTNLRGVITLLNPEEPAVTMRVIRSPSTTVREGRQVYGYNNSHSVLVESKSSTLPATLDGYKELSWVKRAWETGWRTLAVEVHLTLLAPDQGTVGVIEEIGFEIKSVEQIDGKLLVVIPNTGADGPLYGGEGLISPKPGRYPLTQWGGEVKDKDKRKVVPFLKPGSPVFFSAILSEDRSDSAISAGATPVPLENRDVTLGATISIYARVSINGKLKDIHSEDRFQYAFLSTKAAHRNNSLKIKYDLLDELQKRAYFRE